MEAAASEAADPLSSSSLVGLLSVVVVLASSISSPSSLSPKRGWGSSPPSFSCCFSSGLGSAALGKYLVQYEEARKVTMMLKRRTPPKIRL